MKVKLHVKERLYLMNILPQENSLVNYQLKKGLIQKIEVSEKEKEELSFQVNEKTKDITWDAQKDFENPTEFDFNDQERQYVRDAIEKLSDGSHPDEFWLIVTNVYDKMADRPEKKE